MRVKFPGRSLAICFIGMLALLGISKPACAGNITQMVDGFEVTFFSTLPTRDRFFLPSSVTGPVEYTVGAYDDGDNQPNCVTCGGGADPFYNIKQLEGMSPYLSIHPGGSASFVFLSPATHLSILWGTPDVADRIEFFYNGTAVGVLSGSDIQAAFGFGQANRPFPVGSDFNATITSRTRFNAVTLSIAPSSSCCFEFSNIFTR